MRAHWKGSSTAVVAHIAARLFLGYRLEPIKPLCFVLPESGARALFSFCGRHVSLRRRRSGFSGAGPGRNYSARPNERGSPSRARAGASRCRSPGSARWPSTGFWRVFVYALLALWLSLDGLRGTGCGASDDGLEPVVWAEKRAEWCLMLRENWTRE